MTTYHGGKQKIGIDIADAIFQYLMDNDLLDVIEGYCEPFIGMAGVYENILDISDDLRLDWNFIAGDVNTALISMWKHLQKGWVPPISYTKKKYLNLKKSRGKQHERGYIGHACSYRGRFFGTYFDKNNLQTYSKSLTRIGKKIRDVKFYSGIYTQFSDISNYVIYCDPPYANTDKRYYDGVNRVGFDNSSFWTWTKRMAEHNVVFVSEFSIPKHIPHHVIWRHGNEKLYLVLPK
jgi:site-specific DNA-adenine methylase